MTAARTLRVERMGRIAYGPMHDLQCARQREVIEGKAEDTLYLLEHDPVITLGKNTGDGHVLADERTRRERGVELHQTGRGGDVTFHGPGQLVGYPIVQMQEGEKDIRGFVWKVEELVIRTCADFGVRAERVEGLRGVWVGDDKVGAVGIRVSRWTSLHGFALNVSTDLSYFNLIVPCGIEDKGVTSLEKLTGRSIPLVEVEERVIAHAGPVLGRTVANSPAGLRFSARG